MIPEIDVKKIERVCNRLNKSLCRIIESGPVPGATLTVVTNQGLILSEGVGYSNLSQSHEVDSTTIFNIASSSKIFTGIGFMLAVQDGLVSLDDSLVDHWPSFNVNSLFGEDEFKKITFRHLLSHRAGLPREPLVGGIYGNDKCTFEESVESVQDCWMVAPVGNRYWYSNIGFDIVPYALQLITGMSYPSWMKKKLGDPLGLNSLTFGSDAALKNSNTALGTLDGHRLLDYEVDLGYGCGGVWICSSDMVKVLTFLLNEGEFDGSVVLDRSLFREIVRPHFAEDSGHNYGLGVDLSDVISPCIHSHHGGAFGYASTLYWLPEQGIGVSAQANMEWYPGMKKHPHEMAIGAQDKFLKAIGIERKRPLPKELLHQEYVSPNVVDNSQLTGMYVGLPNVVVQILHKNDNLYFSVMRNEEELTPEGNGFLTSRGAGIMFDFESTESRNPRCMSLVSLVHPQGIVPLMRIEKIQATPETQAISTDVIEQIVGLYKATFYGNEPTFIVAWEKDRQLYVRDEMYDPLIVPHPSIPGLFFMPHGETVIHDGKTLWVDNCRGEKWDDPLAELRMLIETNPDHRLLSKNVLTQIAQSLRILGRNTEAKEIRKLKEQLYSKIK
jgi:CubicO group peptidase (beta-lactamase class C family)